jgi:hypothetical protein
MMCCSRREKTKTAQTRNDDRIGRIIRSLGQLGAKQMRVEGRIIADPSRLPQSAERPNFQRGTGAVRLQSRFATDGRRFAGPPPR